MEERQFINRIYLKSLLPVTMAVLLIQICSVANNIIVGKLIGSDGLAVTSLVGPIGFVFAVFGSLLAVGGSIQAAHGAGIQDFEVCNRCLYITLKISVILGILLTAALMVFNGVILDIFNVPDSLRSETRNYIIGFAPAAFAAIGIYIPFNYLKIHGAQKFGVYVSAVMAIVTIGLDFVFVKGFEMGMLGIGLASTLGYWSATLPGIIILYTEKGGFKMPESKAKSVELKSIIVSGSPSAMNNLCNLLRTYVMNLLLIASMGSMGLAAFTVIATMFMFSVTISNGTSFTLSPFAAAFFTERDNKSIRDVFEVSLASVVVLMAIFVVIIEIFPGTVAYLFGVTDASALDLTITALRVFGASLVISGVNTVLAMYYQCIHKSALSNILTVLRSFAIVAAFAFAAVMTGNPEYIWYAFLAAEVLTLVFNLIYTFIYRRINKNLSPVLLLDLEAEKDGRYIAFSVENNVTAATESSAKIIEFCEQNELSPKLTMAIGLAIEEILVLFFDHALKDEKENMRSNVRIYVHEDIIILRFRTAGKQFDPISYSEEQDDMMSDAMGIMMIEKLAEVVRYDRVFGINNLTILF